MHGAQLGRERPGVWGRECPAGVGAGAGVMLGSGSALNRRLQTSHEA
ncbi:hypothetical protein BTL_4483 [Burkholderia thailandensis H0587]|nr:hypothetical protein BTL_4483 [Burkholderia thailandensis H0587]